MKVNRQFLFKSKYIDMARSYQPEMKSKNLI